MLSVFGGTGFIGAAFCAQGEFDCTEMFREETVPETDDILYFISTTHNYHVHADPCRDIETNLIHLMRVLDGTSPGSTFNFISSWFVYGPGTLPAIEDQPCDPRGFYSITKRCAEQLLISYCQTHGINYRIFRLANVYGPGDKKCSKKKNAMQWLVNEVREGRDVELYDAGNTIRDYIHVRDVIRALDICLEKASLNSTTNIGSGKKYKMRNIIEFAKEITGSPSRLINIPPTEFHRQVQVKDFYMDISKLKSYGFKQEITLKAGIRELCK